MLPSVGFNHKHNVNIRCEVRSAEHEVSRSTEGVRGALPQDLLTSPPGLLPDTLVSPVLHVREIFRRVQGSASPGFAHISPRTAP